MKDKQYQVAGNTIKVHFWDQMVLIGIGLALFYTVFDSLLYVFLSYDVTVVQVAGLVARRILCYKQPGDRVGQGERFGFIRYGSRVDVYLAPNSTVDVTIGDKVKSGRDIIAHLVH